MYDPTEPGHVPVNNLHNIPAPPPAATAANAERTAKGISIAHRSRIEFD